MTGPQETTHSTGATGSKEDIPELDRAVWVEGLAAQTI